MKHEMHDNSLACFDSIRDAMDERETAVYGYLFRTGYTLTDRQVMQQLGFTEPNQVRPRITTLVDNRWLVEVDRIKCPVTGMLVRRTKALTADQRAELIAFQRARILAPRTVEQPELFVA